MYHPYQTTTKESYISPKHWQAWLSSISLPIPLLEAIGCRIMNVLADMQWLFETAISSRRDVCLSQKRGLTIHPMSGAPHRRSTAIRILLYAVLGAGKQGKQSIRWSDTVCARVSRRSGGETGLLIVRFYPFSCDLTPLSSFDTSNRR